MFLFRMGLELMFQVSGCSIRAFHIEGINVLVIAAATATATATATTTTTTSTPTSTSTSTSTTTTTTTTATITTSLWSLAVRRGSSKHVTSNLGFRV